MIAFSQIDESHTVSSSWVTTASGSSGFGVNTHGFVVAVVMATSTYTGRRAYCGLVMDGEMVTSRALQPVAPVASVTRAVMPGGAVGFGGVGGGVLVAVSVGGKAVTVAVLVGFASSPEIDGQT